MEAVPFSKEGSNILTSKWIHDDKPARELRSRTPKTTTEDLCINIKTAQALTIFKKGSDRPKVPILQEV